MKNSITLDKNKIYIINQKGVKLAQVDNKGRELAVWDIIKTIRKKNILYCYDNFSKDKIKMTFKSVKYAINCKNQFKNAKM